MDDYQAGWWDLVRGMRAEGRENSSLEACLMVGIREVWGGLALAAWKDGIRARSLFPESRSQEESFENRQDQLCQACGTSSEAPFLRRDL